MGSNRTPRRIRPTIRKDGINPVDYNRYKLPFACEDCSHFAIETESCTLGFMTAPHRRAEQERSYNLSGKVALCRVQEID